MKKLIIVPVLALSFAFAFPVHAQTPVLSQEERDQLIAEIEIRLQEAIMQLIAALQAQLEDQSTTITDLEERLGGVESNQESDTNMNQENQSEPAVSGPTIEVALSQADTGSAGELPAIEGNKFIFMEVTGDWDRSYARMWAENGDLLIGTGYDSPYERTITGQTWIDSENTLGHFYELNNIPPGKYTWKVYAEKNDIEETEEGTFTVEG